MITRAQAIPEETNYFKKESATHGGLEGDLGTQMRRLAFIPGDSMSKPVFKNPMHPCLPENEEKEMSVKVKIHCIEGYWKFQRNSPFGGRIIAIVNRRLSGLNVKFSLRSHSKSYLER